MDLALGTVQFGLAYGIAGRGHPVPDYEVRSILECAWASGVRMLDTAAAYGDIEQRLGHLCTGMAFRIISKIPAVPDELPDDHAARWVVNQATRSRQRLGENLAGMMLHRSADLTGMRGRRIWQELSAWARHENVTLGVSSYAPKDFFALQEQFGISMAQVPGNAFDQRLITDMPVCFTGAEIYLRSAFLQGILLLPLERAKLKLPQAGTALAHWHEWCAEKRLSLLEAALSIVKAFPAVSQVVVGVDSRSHFEEIDRAWKRTRALEGGELAINSLNIIDPREWRVNV